VTGKHNTGGIQVGRNTSFLKEKECMYEKIVPVEEIHVRGYVYMDVECMYEEMVSVEEECM
jgi:hypothetical protein